MSRWRGIIEYAPKHDKLVRSLVTEFRQTRTLCAGCWQADVVVTGEQVKVLQQHHRKLRWSLRRDDPE